jgi:hypothetical protein
VVSSSRRRAAPALARAHRSSRNFDGRRARRRPSRAASRTFSRLPSGIVLEWGRAGVAGALIRRDLADWPRSGLTSAGRRREQSSLSSSVKVGPSQTALSRAVWRSFGAAKSSRTHRAGNPVRCASVSVRLAGDQPASHSSRSRAVRARPAGRRHSAGSGLSSGLVGEPVATDTPRVAPTNQWTPAVAIKNRPAGSRFVSSAAAAELVCVLFRIYSNPCTAPKWIGS